MTAKRRAIYASAAGSLSLARCSVEAQLLFDRLIAAADDQGRQQADPLLVKAACMPLVKRATVRSITTWMAELERADMLICYEAAGQPLVQITHWWPHQDWMRHLYPSRWPAPKGWEGDRVKGHGGGQSADAGPPDGGQMADESRPDGGPDVSGDVSRVGSEIEKDVSRSGGPDSPPRDTPIDIALHRVTTNHRDLTGKPPNESAEAMYRDLLGRYGADVVGRAQYRCASFDRKDYGFVGRVKAECKRLAA